MILKMLFGCLVFIYVSFSLTKPNLKMSNFYTKSIYTLVFNNDVKRGVKIVDRSGQYEDS